DDRGEEQVVPPARAAPLAHPRRSVAGADVDEAQLGIVGHVVPHRPPAAALPPFAGPGRGGHAHGLVLEAVGRIARHGMPAPREFTGLGIAGRDIAAYAELRAAVADQDLAPEHELRTGDRVVLRIVDRELRPHRLAG